jgi:hypothetical protein
MNPNARRETLYSRDRALVDGILWAHYVTAARTARDGRLPVKPIPTGWYGHLRGDATSTAVLASAYADELTARYGATEVSEPGTSIDVGFHGNAASWTSARWEAHHWARCAASMGVYVLGGGRIIG